MGSVFGLSNYMIDTSSFSGGNFDIEPDYYTSMPMGMGPNSPTATVMIVKSLNKEGCINYYTLEVHVDYDASTESAAKVVTVLMGSGASHNTYQSIALKYEGTKCDDGVIVTTSCYDCGEKIGETLSTPNSNQHYYIKNSLPFVFDKEKSALGHEAKFDVYVCACGSRKYELVADNCYFEKVEGTENEYACNCGYRYKEVIKNEDGFYSCEKRTKQVVYYDYDSENGTYLNSTAAIPGYVYTYNHTVKGVIEYVNARGCKTDYVRRYVCDCGKYEKYSWQSEGTTYLHNKIETETVSPDGSVTSVIRCKDCDYVFETVVDAEDNTMYRYFVTDDPDADEVVKVTTMYTVINGELCVTFEKKEIYDRDGELKTWKQTACFYNAVENGSIYKVQYTVDSLGNSSFEELY